MNNQTIAGLHVWLNESSRGRLTIAIHGGCASGRIWETVAESFGNSVRFFAPDLPGHGRSAVGCPLGKLTIGHYTEALLRLSRVFPYERIDILAHSMGALPALELAARAPHIIRKIVLLNPVPPWTLITPSTMFRALKYLPSFTRGTLWKYTRDDYQFLLCTCAADTGCDVTPALAEMLYREQEYESGTAARQMCLGLVRPRVIDCPIMVVGAHGDRLIPTRFLDRMVRRYSAHYYSFPGAHLSIFDPTRAWVWKYHIMPWLDRPVP